MILASISEGDTKAKNSPTFWPGRDLLEDMFSRGPLAQLVEQLTLNQ